MSLARAWTGSASTGAPAAPPTVATGGAPTWATIRTTAAPAATPAREKRRSATTGHAGIQPAAAPTSCGIPITAVPAAMSAPGAPLAYGASARAAVVVSRGYNDQGSGGDSGQLLKVMDNNWRQRLPIPSSGYCLTSVSAGAASEY